MKLIVSTWTFLASCVLAYNEQKEYWLQDGIDGIQSIWQMKPNYKKADNLILMVGDGMGLSTITAGRIYQGQKKGKSGEENKLTFEQFPYLALSKTYNVDRQVPDSAATAVSMVTGIKVNYGTLGVSIDVPFEKDCKNFTDSTKLKTVLDYALEEGKSVGIVTTTRITHATPAAAYAHTPHRDWEGDFNIEAANCSHVKDIAYQLIMDNPNIQVIMGGGRRHFMNNTTPDPVSGYGQRSDGLDLIQAWKNDKSTRNVKHQYVYDRQQLKDVDVAQTDYLFGLFAPSHMSYEADRLPSSVEPTLTEMTEKAIQILKKNPKGYFLLIEGGRIDHSHHENGAKRALEEVVEFDNAVAKVNELTSPENTLTVVTADHSHVFAIAGYPTRGNNILGLVDSVSNSELPEDKMPYLTLGYLNGPYSERVNLTGVDTTTNNFRQPGCIQMSYETHGGEDVIIYGKGPMAHLLQGTKEQSYIGHVLMYSACIGVYKDNCDLIKRSWMVDPQTLLCSAIIPKPSMLILLTIFIVIFRTA
ncbi:alkaline phosphatase-like [Biomphalaria glabrata]|uniref:alkaline phosphatase n=2 Tax=Biomphalaria glabrata TaxID=6526 RepID=A0A9W2YLM7_BIOGL|nr:alkaline phosphatase-like [Biomphalaria glabrata]XP_055863561.1 alkaline phosphatase-like [Biomphalaria glabrata]XP_055863562.1 alkaline phosphatase-like [Biomphalaria glabrata]XP_055863563.1 alkaline phosphatase-like [Biomphalaria glabrata]XP_055863564.1 alkaline phosphatase-like [Biomphalaria glabrata]